jgi:hypothetical protein
VLAVGGAYLQVIAAQAAYRWIEERLLPVFEKQEANRRKGKS